MNILVSACLLGLKCRYNCVETEYENIIKLKERHNIIPICPEIMGGLPTPRHPAEIIDGKVITDIGTDVTKEYNTGADEVLKLAKIMNCKYAVLKERSPSCGSGEIYDGTFSRTVTEGDGITAALLKKNGITVLDENNFDKLL